MPFMPYMGDRTVDLRDPRRMRAEPAMPDEQPDPFAWAKGFQDVLSYSQDVKQRMAAGENVPNPLHAYQGEQQAGWSGPGADRVYRNPFNPQGMPMAPKDWNTLREQMALIHSPTADAKAKSLKDASLSFAATGSVGHGATGGRGGGAGASLVTNPLFRDRPAIDDAMFDDPSRVDAQTKAQWTRHRNQWRKQFTDALASMPDASYEDVVREAAIALRDNPLAERVAETDLVRYIKGKPALRAEYEKEKFKRMHEGNELWRGMPLDRQEQIRADVDALMSGDRSQQIAAFKRQGIWDAELDNARMAAAQAIDESKLAPGMEAKKIDPYSLMKLPDPKAIAQQLMKRYGLDVKMPESLLDFSRDNDVIGEMSGGPAGGRVEMMRGGAEKYYGPDGQVEMIRSPTGEVKTADDAMKEVQVLLDAGKRDAAQELAAQFGVDAESQLFETTLPSDQATEQPQTEKPPDRVLEDGSKEWLVARGGIGPKNVRVRQDVYGNVYEYDPDSKAWRKEWGRTVTSPSLYTARNYRLGMGAIKDSFQNLEWLKGVRAQQNRKQTEKQSAVSKSEADKAWAKRQRQLQQ